MDPACDPFGGRVCMEKRTFSLEPVSQVERLPSSLLSMASARTLTQRLHLGPKRSELMPRRQQADYRKGVEHRFSGSFTFRCPEQCGIFPALMGTLGSDGSLQRLAALASAWDSRGGSLCTSGLPLLSSTVCCYSASITGQPGVSHT